MPPSLAPHAIAAAALLALVADVQAQKPKEAWEYLQEPSFKTAYTSALGPMAKTPWLAKRDGPAPQDKFITVGGERYVMNSFCKNRDCQANSAVLLYSPEKKLVYGTVHEKGKQTVIGSPPPGVAAELGKLWQAEWRTPAR
ncbi:MAG: Ivy family c-type lysozyme inhibitor [Caldimonas sp.]